MVGGSTSAARCCASRRLYSNPRLSLVLYHPPQSPSLPRTQACILWPRRESSSSSDAASLSSSSSPSLSQGSTFAASLASAARLTASCRKTLAGAPRGLTEYGRMSPFFSHPTSRFWLCVLRIGRRVGPTRAGERQGRGGSVWRA